VSIAAFDEFGVDGVYKVMKAERLSRKSLTAGVTLSLAGFAATADGFTEVYAGVSSCRW
jgi:hypothetical protein